MCLPYVSIDTRPVTAHKGAKMTLEFIYTPIMSRVLTPRTILKYVEISHFGLAAVCSITAISIRRGR